MADDFKSTVSRTLDTTNRQYTNVVWQAGKPPLDSELNLVGQLATDNLSKTVSATAHSGILMNPRTADRDFEFHPLWSNFLKVKPLKALVNGLVLDIEESMIKLDPPPTQDNRVDFVFLEVWKTIISADNALPDATLEKVKPTTTTVYSNGNLSGAGLDDEMVDSNVGFETTKRIQVQYRFRVVKEINIYDHLEGMSSTLVKGQGPLDAPDNNCVFNNQHANGDAGLWIAHMTSDGCPLGQPCDPNVPNTALSDFLSENIVYGIPICAITRRNDNSYVASTNTGNANQNGAIDRKPSSNTSTDATSLLQATLSSPLDALKEGNVAISNGDGSGLDDAQLYGSERYLVLGQGLNKEIIRVSGFANNALTVVARGEGGTQAKYHSAGTNVVLFNNRPDGKYADEIHADDLFDMRHATTIGEWDYQSLLESSLSDLLFGNLKTAYKQNQQNNTTAGGTVEEVSTIDQSTPMQTHHMDWPNGFRDAWSDASVPQMGLTMYLNLPSARDNFGVTTTNLNQANLASWTIGPDLEPSAFIYDGLKMKSGSWVKLTLDATASNLAYGVNEIDKANTPQEKGVRFIAPSETRDPSTKRSPFTIEEVGVNHGQLHYPTLASNFEKPFIVLGKTKYSDTFLASTPSDVVNQNYRYLYRPQAINQSSVVSEQQTGNLPPSFVEQVVAVRLGASGVDLPLAVRNLESLVTNNGYDTSGDHSSLYAVIYGDPRDNFQQNNGVFKVVDLLNDDLDTPNATYYKTSDTADVWDPSTGGGSKVGWVILKPIDDIVRSAGLGDRLLKIEFRTQELSNKDDEVMVAITESVDHDIANTTLGKLSITSEFQLGVSVLYPSATGGTANVADDIHKIGLIPDISTGEFLNNSKSVLHGNDFSNLPLVGNEIDLPTKNHVSLWNRLPSSNLPIGVAQPSQMGGRIINEESDREAEAFTDENSKTVVLRPFQNKTVIINKATANNLTANGVVTQTKTSLVPEHWNNTNIDVDLEADEMFLPTKNAAFVLPEAIMPRFGRQDIPLHTYTGTEDQFRNGLNHIFIDKPLSQSDQVFNIIGGLDNGGSPGTNNVLFVTGDPNTAWGQRQAINTINSKIGIGARRTTFTDVPSSDFGSTLNGIELPPYYGIVRVYGVYERDLFATHLTNQNQLAGHAVNRVDVANNVTNGNCPNLLRTDTSAFTMYIRQNGGKELVNGVDGQSNTDYLHAHTYMITEHAIDISRLEGLKDPNNPQQDIWSEGSVFTSFNYVVEAVVFMFADGFISHNRYVLPRKHNGSGSALLATDEQKAVVSTVIPFAPPIGSHITVSYKRTPYQGDPLGTLGQSDQTVPQGRKSLNKLRLGTKVQPVNLSNTNERNLEVLASIDFYTTLGTGKIGGVVYPTTITDVGHTPFPINRDPTALLADGFSYITLKTSTFTEESSLRGGWASLFLFEQAETVVRTIVDLKLYKNNSLVDTHTLSDNGDGRILETQVSYAMEWLQGLGYNCFQIRGEIRQNATINQTYLGVLIQAPNPTDTFELEVDWKDLRNGQDIQIFEGLRESPMSFEMWFQINPFRFNFEDRLNSRSMSRVHFSKINAPKINAGNGNTPISLTGITSRLPIGSLVRDSDFVCEDILNNSSSYLFSSSGSYTTISNPVPVSPDGIPYTIALGVSGDTIQMNDGKIFNGSTPAADPKYTIARGGGAVFNAGGNVPGGPLSFLATSFNESLQPVLKGSALVGRALLVSNNYEEDRLSNPKSYGSELQLVVVTHAVDGGTSSITLGGDISPSGYGEGLASADRFRIKGKPLVKVYSQASNLSVVPAPYNSSN
jgi:hypothetical protein